jgi:hypothetical protein
METPGAETVTGFQLVEFVPREDEEAICVVLVTEATAIGNDDKPPEVVREFAGAFTHGKEVLNEFPEAQTTEILRSSHHFTASV